MKDISSMVQLLLLLVSLGLLTQAAPIPIMDAVSFLKRDAEAKDLWEPYTVNTGDEYKYHPASDWLIRDPDAQPGDWLIREAISETEPSDWLIREAKEGEASSSVDKRSAVSKPENILIREPENVLIREPLPEAEPSGWMIRGSKESAGSMYQRSAEPMPENVLIREPENVLIREPFSEAEPSARPIRGTEDEGADSMHHRAAESKPENILIRDADAAPSDGLIRNEPVRDGDNN